MEELKAAQAWFLGLDDEQVKEVMLKAYRDHLAHVAEREALGFKWGVE